MVYNLEGIKAGSIVEYNEAESFGITNAADPAAYMNLCVQIFFTLFKKLFYCCQLHCFSPSVCLFGNKGSLCQYIVFSPEIQGGKRVIYPVNPHATL